jgi:hypothetical protein
LVENPVSCFLFKEQFNICSFTKKGIGVKRLMNEKGGEIEDE